MQMNRRFYLIPRDKKFSNQFSFHFSINDDGQPASRSFSEQRFDKREKSIQYKNNTFEDKTRNNHQYT